MLVLLGSFFLFSKIKKKTTWVTAQVIMGDGELWWDGEPVQYWMVDALEPGMYSKNSFGEKVAKITDVESFSIGGKYKSAVVTLDLKVTYDTEKELYLYNYQPIEKGKSIDINFGTSKVMGLVTGFGETTQRVWKKMLVKQVFVEDWVAENYYSGMEMKDSKDRVLAKVNNVTVTNSKTQRVSVYNGELYMSGENFKDLIYEIEVLSTKDSDGTYRFVDGTPLKVGNTIWFNFSNVEAQTKIMNLIE